MKTKTPLHRIDRLLIAALALSCAPSFAATVSWDGGTSGTGTSWSSANNWVGDATPAAGDDVVFSNTTGGVTIPSTMSVSGARTFGLITFDNVASKLPSTLTIDSNGSGTTARTLTVNSGINLTNTTTTVFFRGSNGTLSYAMGGDNTFTVSSGASLIFGSAVVISGNFNATKDGAGALTLSNANTFGGVGKSFTLNAGILNINNASALGDAANTFVINGGTINNTSGAAITMGNYAQTWGGNFTFTGTTNLNLGAGAVNLTGTRTVTVSARALTVGGAITNTGGITKAGAGTLILNGANTYSGTTTLNAGTLALGNVNALQNSLLDTGSSGAQVLTFTVGGNNTYNIGGLSGSDDIALSANRISVGANNTDTTYAGALSGTGGLNKVGTATLTLTGVNSYNGGTVVSGGRLVGDTRSLQGAITNTAAVTFSQTTNGTYGGVISGSGGTVTKSGTGTVTFTQNNTYTGATTVSGGRLVVNGSQSSSAVTVNSGASLAGSGTVGGLTVSGLLAPGTSVGTLSAGSTTFEGGGSFELEIFDWVNVAGTGWDLFAITGDLTLNNTSGSPFTINLVSLANSTTPGLSTDWDQNVNFTNTFVTVSGSLLGTPFASNLFTVNTNGFQNTVNGTFSITNVGNNLALLYTTSFVPATEYIWNTGAGAWGTGGSWSGGVAPSNNSAIIFSGAGGASTNNLVNTVQSLLFSNSAGSYTVSGDALTVGALGIDNESTAAQAINNNLTLGAAQTFLAANGDLTFGGTIDNSGNLLTIAGNSNTAINGAISGNGGLTKSGTGSLTLGGNNSYTGALSANGGTTLVNGTQAVTTINVGGGTLLLGASDVLANGATVALTTGTVNFGGFSDTITTFNQSGGVFTNGTLTATTYGLSGGTVGGTLGAGTANVTGGVTLSGVIDSTLNINTGGTLTLAAADRIGNSSAVTVNAGTLATATFNDTVGSVVLTNSGSITGTGTITAGTYTLNGGTVGANLGTGTATSSAGTTTLNGTLAGDLAVSGGTLTLGGADRLGNSSAVTVSTGTLNFGGFTDAVGSFSLSGGIFTNGTVTATTYALSGGTMGGTLGAGTANVTGGVTLSGVIDSTLNINTGGTLTLAAADRINNSSAVTVNAGTLATATFNDTVGSLLLTNNGSITGTGTITAGTYTLNGGTVSANLGAGTANVSAGTTTLSGTLAAATLNINGGTLGLGANARIDNATVVNLSSGSLNMSTFSDGVGTFNMTGGTVDGTGTLTASNGLAIQAGTINANIGSSTVAISNGATTINGSVGGAVTVSSGTADLNGALASSLTASGGTVNLSNTVAGNVTVSGGTVNLGSADRIGNSSAVNVSSGALNLGGNDTVGAVTLTGGTIGGSGKLTGASFNVQSGAISVGIDGSGAMTKTGSGSTTLSGDSSTYNGNVTVGGGALIAANNNALGSAAVTMTNGSLFAASGVTNANTITIGTAGGGGFVTNSFSSTTVAGWDFSTNAGGIGNFGPSPMAATTNAEGVSIVGLTRGSGVTTAGSGAANAWGGDGWSTSNNATAAIADGDFAFFSVTVSNGFALNLTNFASYNVRRSGSGPTTGLWQWSTNGVDFVDIGSAITWGSNTTSAGNAQSAISFTNINQLQGLGAGLTVTFRVANYGASGTGTWYLSDPSDTTALDFLLNGQIATVTGGGAASGSGTLGISEAGTATFSGNIVNNNEATFTAASGGTATFSGIVSGEGTLNKTGAGTVTLSGASANTFTGLTTVSAGTLQLNKTTDTAAIAGDVTVNSGAVLLISASNQVNDSSAVSLSGGTITRGSGVSEVFGALTLNDDSFLDFGTGATGTLSFTSYTPSALLTINNFLPGNTLTFGSNLTDDINNTALFSFDNGFNSSWNSGTSTFTITAIPEPSTYLAAAGLLSLMLWPSRRRIIRDAKKILGLKAPMRDRLSARRA